MTVIANNDTNRFYRNACIVMIWCMSVYSSIIQQKYIAIPKCMLILGGSIILTYILANNGTIVLREVITQENELMIYYLAYMLIIGLFFSPSKYSHLSQWITCLEYLSMQIVIASIIKDSETNVFILLLIVIAVILAIVFLREPVNYLNSGRYSISNEFDPNGLGMAYAAGIWAILYQQQTKKLSLTLIITLIVLFGYCILMTGSRKSLIAAGLIIVLWVPFCFLPSLRRKGVLLGIATFLCLLFLGIVITRRFINLYADSTIATRMDNLIYETQEGNRSLMYRQGFELLKTNPLFGVGFQGFSYYFGSYSHATIIEIPVSGGIIGAILYFSAYVVSIKKGFIIYRKTKRIPELINEQIRVKMILILWVAILFYTVCIIHPYQFDSAIMFGIIFGETAHLESRLVAYQEEHKKSNILRIGSKYIKNA